MKLYGIVFAAQRLLSRFPHLGNFHISGVILQIVGRVVRNSIIDFLDNSRIGDAVQVLQKLAGSLLRPALIIDIDV